MNGWSMFSFAAKSAATAIASFDETMRGGGAQVAGALAAHYVLILIMLAGAFGGFVDGLLHQKSYFFRLGNRNIDLGSLGDAFVGITASLAMFTVAGAGFNIQWGNAGETGNFIRVIAWGVLSGFAGIRFLNPLSEKTIEQIAGRTAREAVKQSQTLNEEAVTAFADAQRFLANYDIRHKELDAAGKYADAEELLQKAEALFDIVLKANRDNSQALRGKARVYRRRAERPDVSPKQAEEYWNAAFQFLNSIIGRDGGAASAYYTLACYKALTGRNEEAFSNLEKAVQIYDTLKESAKVDADFNKIREDAR